ncbi:GNAT family N-acetyltransferase [Christiangramia sp.]|uniref:GNAT family N-acetyltransferase n=1 Tax=Christiangramia sp. TaxID=1931228 RepID=UPI00345BEE04
MNESMMAILNFGFQILNLEKVEAFTQKQNRNSISLLIKNNFLLNEKRNDQNNIDNIIFELNRPVANNC